MYAAHGGAGGGGGAKFKVVLLGETGVGKSSLVQRLVQGDFTEGQKSTVGASFFHCSVPVRGGHVYLDLWDTAGQERYRALAKMYYRGASAAIVTYDITSAGSFVRAQEWVRELHTQSTDPLILVLAGNKRDLVDDDPTRRRVAAAEVEQYAHEHSALVVETSAKDATNVRGMFARVAAELVAAQNAAAPPPDPDGDASGHIRLGRRLPSRDRPSQPSGCCGT
eukprot:TRINITY_DN15332_c0_g1_i1.p1 TRINITY_DN15332_c0_g1~~TRINITY_DN15332_c0_g1_i1.p1  ORF type:complete len:223 (+),score=79.74 TRINITY_DN15332_c0_g1_i1:167-835(+)